MKLAYLHPRYWLVWFGFGLLWVLVQMPWRLQMSLGKALGLLMYHTLKRRRFVACVNMELAFPELDAEERMALVRKHFISLGQSVFETPLGWWGRKRLLQRLHQTDGIEHLQQAQKSGQGIILMSAHFNSLEVGVRSLSMQFPLNAVYRAHQNPLIDHVVATARAKEYGNAIPREDIRGMIRYLQKGEIVWFAQDQNFGHKNSVFADFFGVPAATNTSLSRLAKMGKALVIPFFTIREKQGYRLVLLPALDPFPGESKEADAEWINRIIETQIRKAPEQYLWTHRRYKDLPEGGNRYDDYREKNGVCCDA